MTYPHHGNDLTKAREEICRKYDSPAIVPEDGSKMGIAIDTLHRMPITGCRIESANGTNGWFIHVGEYDDDSNFYKAVHLCHLPELLPRVLPYLALAPGYRFLIDNEGYEDVWHDPALAI